MKKNTMTFEEGKVNETYNDMVDFGLSNNLILKLIINGVIKEQVINDNYNKDLFD